MAQVGSPSEELDRGRAAFARGEYRRAVEILRPLLYPDMRLQSERDVVLAHRLLGVSYLFENQGEQATREFRRLLQLQPGFRFDPLLDPPQVVDFFNGVVREYQTELTALEARRRALERDRQREREELERLRAGPTVVERRYAKNSFAVNFIPFGAGQFQNGQRTKGWVFLGTQSTLAAVSVGAFSTNFALYGVRPKRRCLVNMPVEGVPGGCPQGAVDTTDESRSRALTRVQLISGGLFFAAVAWGITDAIVNWQPEVEVPSPEAAGTTAPRPRAARSTLTLFPLLLGDATVGPGLAFRF